MTMVEKVWRLKLGRNNFGVSSDENNAKAALVLISISKRTRVTKLRDSCLFNVTHSPSNIGRPPFPRDDSVIAGREIK